MNTKSEQALYIVNACIKYRHDYYETTDSHLATLLSILFAESGYTVSLAYVGNTGTVCAAYTPE